MSFLRKSDYAKENTNERRSVGYTTKRGARIPTQMKSTSYDNKFLILCPRGCTQNRTHKHALKQKKTFDIRTNTCRNCGFKKLRADARPAVRFEKASAL